MAVVPRDVSRLDEFGLLTYTFRAADCQVDRPLKGWLPAPGWSTAHTRPES